MSEQHDRVFLKKFSVAIGALVAFTIVILLVALAIDNMQKRDSGTAREAAKVERLQPVAGVYTGESERAASEPEPEAAAEEEPELAFDGSTDGKTIYDRVCAACHDAGVAGAPILEEDAWGDRLDKGRDELVATAISGIGAMPPRGGRNDLSDEQVAASVDYMLDQLD